MIIRDHVQMSASLPKVLAPGDKVNTVLELYSTDGAAGTYELSVATDDVVKLEPFPTTLELAAGERRVLVLSMKAVKPGTARLDFEISYDGESLSQVSRAHNLAYDGIQGETVSVIYILVAGEPPIHRLPKQPVEPVNCVLARTAVAQRRRREIG